MAFLSISCFLVSLFSFLIGGFVFAENPRKEINIVWALFSFSVSLWALGYYLTFTAGDYQTALVWAKIHNYFAIGIPVFFLHFVYQFQKMKSKIPYLIYFLGSCLLALCIAFNQAFIPTVSSKGPFNYYDNPGVLFLLFSVFFFSIVSYGSMSLFIGYRQAKGIEKERFKYILFGLMLGFGGGSTSFFYVYDIYWYPFGVIGILFYVLLTTVAITKHQLFDIRLVFSRALSLLIVGGSSVSSVVIAYFFGLQSILLCSIFLFWTFFGHKISLQIQLIIDRIFLKESYKSEEITNRITSDILQVEDVYIALELIASNLKSALGASFVFALFPFKVVGRDILSYRISQLQVRHSTSRDFDEGDPKLDYFKSIDGAQYISGLPECEKALEALMSNEKNLADCCMVPLISAENFYGFLLLGPRFSQTPYYKSDLDFLDTISNYTAAIFDRIVHHEHLLCLNQKIAKLNETLELRVREELILRQKAMDAAYTLSHRASLSTLTLGIAHEIRNPLTIIDSSASYTLDLIQSRTKLMKLMPNNKPVMSGLFSEEVVTELVTQDLQRTVEIKQFLIEAAILDSEGKPFENQNPIHPRFALKLPQNLEMFHGKLLAYLRRIYAESQIIYFLQLASKETKRVVTIADSMMMYGATGEGLSRSAFTEHLGDELSELAWNDMLAQGVLDSEGHITDYFTPDFREQDLHVAQALLPHRGLIFKTLRGAQYALFKTISVDDMLNEIADLQRSHYRKLNIAMSIELGFKRHIKGNPTTLRRVIMNLLSNAVEAMEQTSEGQKSISITTQPDEFITLSGAKLKGVKISISDTGSGISQENLTKIHNPFFSTKSMTGGKNIGLGLSFVFQTIRRHNGVILVDSELGKGTTFHVNLPGEMS